MKTIMHKLDTIAFFLFFVFLVQVLTIEPLFCQTNPAPAPAAVTQPAVTAQVTSQVSSAPAVVVSTPTVAVPVPAAPPQWAIDFITEIQKLPILGPIATKVFVYAGIVGAVMTAIVSSLWAILTALSSISGLSGLASLEEKLTAFKNGKIMYYLAFLSLFNAKQPTTTPVSKS